MFLQPLHSIINSQQLLLLIEVISCSIKIYLFLFLFHKATQSARMQKNLILLLTVLACGLIVDFSWILVLLQATILPTLDYRLGLFITRIAWGANYILFLALGFFIESLSEKNFTIKLRQKILTCLGFPWILYFITIAFIQNNNNSLVMRSIELYIMQFGTLFIPLFLILPSLYFTIRKISTNSFPKILKKQLSILIKYLITPYLFTQSMDIFALYYHQLSVISCLSNTFLACAIYFSISKIMKLRFLNLVSNVQPPQNFEFIDHFKTFLSTITNAKSLNEVTLIVKTFFQESLHINTNKIMLCYRNTAFYMPQSSSHEPHVLTQCEAAFERLVNNPVKNEKLLNAMKQQKILIYDEVEFSNFYQEEELNKEVLNFMNEIRAEIFLPIYEQHNLIAYLIIGSTTHDNKNKVFNNLEHDQMVIVASYLGHIITMLQLSNYRELIAHNKVLHERLYQTHQENNQYRESIQSFLHDNRQRQTGLLFYKNYHFSFGNQAAKELISVNITILDNHPITVALKKLIKQTHEYKSSQSVTVHDLKGNTLVLTAVPYLEKNHSIITVSYPEISDTLKQQINQLRNPSEWEYLLYLQTTQSGKLINRLIPGSSKSLLNFKIEVLRAALSKNAVLLDLPEDDLEATAEILHHISLRENRYKLIMNSYEKNNTIAVKLFGMNPLFGTLEPALLEQLNGTGTLFIQDIHLLELTTQEALAEFIKYGYYTVCKSNKRVFADVRVICSTTQNLRTLVQDGKFSKTLFDELSKTTLTMPSLFNLHEEEFDELITEFSQQELSTKKNQIIVEFNSHDKEQLRKTRSISLNEFRKKINQIINEKSSKHEIYHNAAFDTASHLADSQLAIAARLGKNVLRDKQKLTMLMEKFDYNQNKVAAFLGVNRSSINRRLKTYTIKSEENS
jgi:DNA-binding NtrC family response regulator